MIGENEKKKKRNLEVAQVSLRGREDNRVNCEKQNLKEHAINRPGKSLKTYKIKSCQSIQPHQYKSFRIPIRVEANKNGERFQVEIYPFGSRGRFCLISASFAEALEVVHKILPVPMRFRTAD
ncbi:hypothetical protein Golomagni_04649 [Golovinomyces magnicellulatus]|nr:hypothetical protein Golomagni_04649 [Golovinomyces magnicellulatus]